MFFSFMAIHLCVRLRWSLAPTLWDHGGAVRRTFRRWWYQYANAWNLLAGSCEEITTSVGDLLQAVWEEAGIATATRYRTEVEIAPPPCLRRICDQIQNLKIFCGHSLGASGLPLHTCAQVSRRCSSVRFPRSAPRSKK